MRFLRPVHNPGVEHCALIEKLCATMWDGTQLVDVLLDCAVGDLQLWEGDGFLVITEIAIHPGGRELFLYGIAGEGILAVGKSVLEDLKEIAAANDCKWIGGSGIPRGWLRYGQNIGFKVVATRYLMEV